MPVICRLEQMSWYRYSLMKTKIYDYLELQWPNPFPLCMRDRLKQEILLGDSPGTYEMKIFLRLKKNKMIKHREQKDKKGLMKQP